MLFYRAVRRLTARLLYILKKRKTYHIAVSVLGNACSICFIFLLQFRFHWAGVQTFHLPISQRSGEAQALVLPCHFGTCDYGKHSPAIPALAALALLPAWPRPGRGDPHNPQLSGHGAAKALWEPACSAPGPGAQGLRPFPSGTCGSCQGPILHHTATRTQTPSCSQRTLPKEVTS